jgi:transcriptional regulator with XRE-family HTH domain
MASSSIVESALGRQLLSQLGSRLKAERQERGISSVQLARQLGISRTTLHAVESGDASPSIGVYVRVMAALGLVGDLALLGTGESEPQLDAPIELSRSAVSRPHAAQDYQSLLMHRVAVRLLQADPALVQRVTDTLDRWMTTADSNAQPLLQAWRELIARGKWAHALANTERARELRQASPLTTIVPDDVRLNIIRKVKQWKRRQHETA